MAYDIEIARAAKKKPIRDIAAALGIAEGDLIPFGHDIAKINHHHIASLRQVPDGKLILVTSITPTHRGEGKTTVSIGLTDAMNKLGHKTTLCLREPAMAPLFTTHGGGTGGGLSQVVPMDEINLHFTGDFHAVASAHNLLSAVIDNHIHWGSESGLYPTRVTWRRAQTLYDRSLRTVVTGLGGTGNGTPMETGFDSTSASEILSILSLAGSPTDLKRRLDRIVIGYKAGRQPVLAKEMKATGAMMALMNHAILPNLVQTLENSPVLIHGGPTATLSHGCNSVVSTRAALKMSDYTVIESGFGADTGAEKFLNITCRQAGFAPDAAVLVTTVRTLKFHGGLKEEDADSISYDALELGLANLGRHIENLRLFGIPVIVAINRVTNDSSAEISAIESYCQNAGVPLSICTNWAQGGHGAIDLAGQVTHAIRDAHPSFKPLYSSDLPLTDKIEAVGRKIYRASDVQLTRAAREQLSHLQDAGYGHLPVCLAKTPFSFSTDPAVSGAPDDHTLRIRSVQLAAGAGYIVCLTNDDTSMPGMPKSPSAEQFLVTPHGVIEGLS